MKVKDMLKTWTNLVNTEETKQINYEWEEIEFGPFIKRRINKDDIHKIDLMTKEGKIFIGCYPTGIVENNTYVEEDSE